MKRLLRGVIDFGGISAEALDSNYQRLCESSIEWVNPEDERLAKFVREFYTVNLEVPSAATVRDFFEREGNVEVLERLKDIDGCPIYERRQYSHLLDQLVEDQRRVKMDLLLKDAKEINGKGRVVQEGRRKVKLQGVNDAVAYLNDKIPGILPTPKGPRSKGFLDPEEEWNRYRSAKDSPNKYGTLSGFNTIDKACRGLKRGELWVHAGFSGDFKSTFATQWSYNAVHRYRANVIYISMEMPLEQLQRRLCTLHSSAATFKLAGKDPLDGCRVRDGELTGDEEVFYKEVLQDLKDEDGSRNYCRLHIWQAPSPSVAAIRTELERLHRTMDIDLVVIDHTELLGRPANSRDPFGVQLNDMIRGLKQLALHFAGGVKLPVLLLHQLNREGRKRAEKADGKYGLYDLSYANEAERSADVVTTSYASDEMRASHEVVVSNLKNRDNPRFEPVRLSLDPRCLRLYEPLPASERFVEDVLEVV